MENKVVNWYPGHMFKAKKQIEERIKSVDAVIEIIDSRVPISSHNDMLDKIVRSKPRMILFSKRDLVEAVELKPYEEYYQSLGYQTYALDVTNNSFKDKVIKQIELLCKPILDDYESKGMHKTLRLLVIGMPNVGKSSFINMIAGKKKLIVANRPGVTKAQEVIKITDNIELVDTPGVLVPKIETLQEGYNLVLNSLIKDNVVELQDIAFYLLKYLIKNRRSELLKRYPQLNEEALDDYINDPEDLYNVESIYEGIGKSIGYYSNANGPDYERITVRLVNDYRKQKFGKIILDTMDTNEK